MCSLFRNRFRNESSRLPEYDYSKSGAYFITICTTNHECSFGEIIDHQMVLSESGKIAFQKWFEIQHHFPFVILDEFVVMPNHIHGIIVIKPTPVGTLQSIVGTLPPFVGTLHATSLQQQQQP